jgi:hypothetical protein
MRAALPRPQPSPPNPRQHENNASLVSEAGEGKLHAFGKAGIGFCGLRCGLEIAGAE